MDMERDVAEHHLVTSAHQTKTAHFRKTGLSEYTCEFIKLATIVCVNSELLELKATKWMPSSSRKVINNPFHHESEGTQVQKLISGISMTVLSNHNDQSAPS